MFTKSKVLVVTRELDQVGGRLLTESRDIIGEKEVSSKLAGKKRPVMLKLVRALHFLLYTSTVIR
jgi:hypothetical protein